LGLDPTAGRPWTGAVFGVDGQRRAMDGDRLLNLAGGALLVFVLGTVVLVGYLVATGVPTESGDDGAANWTVERVNDTHVTVEHAGGPPVQAADVVVSVDNNERQTGWSGRVVQGESATVRAGPETVVRVVLGDGDDREVLLQERV